LKESTIYYILDGTQAIRACCPCKSHDLEQVKLSATPPKSVPRKAAPMGAVRAQKGVDSSLELIVKRLRDEGEHVVREAVPHRWVDLIHYLNEQERKDYDRSAADEVAEAELADATQEKALQELIRTDEPTEEASKLLETLRRNVARAIAKR
jgi:hypothetical protein